MIDPKRLTESAFTIYEETIKAVDRNTMIKIDKGLLKEYSDRGRPVDSAKLSRIIKKYYEPKI